MTKQYRFITKITDSLSAITYAEYMDIKDDRLSLWNGDEIVASFNEWKHVLREDEIEGANETN